MNALTFWNGLGPRARAGLAAGAAAIVALTVAIGVLLLRTEREVLFAGLSPQDASVMTAELDRMKVPYALGPDGASILVERGSVHATRLKLLGKDLPLRGTVGFELFNNSDFGMTDFAQKINYQRALQGELTRTILSLGEVDSARVHLALPEEGLFKRETQRPKASITLGLKRQQALRPEQIHGIQRLVAAAVPGIAVADVTIVDTQGVALTRVADPSTGAEGHGRLDLKRDIEQHLLRKVEAVLERTFGAGQALTSVDVTLNMNQVRVTTEDVTAPPARKGERPTGVIVRERESSKDDGAVQARKDAPPTTIGSQQRETDYQVGRRVEQVVSQPGSIERVQVLAVIRMPLRPPQIDQVRALVSAAVGASALRGDVVVVQPLEVLGAAAPATAPLPAATPDLAVAPATAPPQPVGATVPERSMWVVSALAALLAVVALVGLAWQRRAVRRNPGAVPLTPQQREQALAAMRQWLGEPMAEAAPQAGAQHGR